MRLVFTSRKTSAMSCMSRTSVPTRVRLQVHEKAIRAMVVMWWMNISLRRRGIVKEERHELK